MPHEGDHRVSRSLARLPRELRNGERWHHAGSKGCWRFRRLLVRFALICRCSSPRWDAKLA
jgi:hypothetical protein